MIRPFLFPIFLSIGKAVDCNSVVSKTASFTNLDCQDKCENQQEDFNKGCEIDPGDCFSNVILGLPASSEGTRVKTPQECQQACQFDPQCFRFVFVNDPHHEGTNCFLKGEEEVRNILGSPVGTEGSKLCPDDLLQSLEEWEMPLLECKLGRLCVYQSDAFTTGPRRCSLRFDILKQNCPVLDLTLMSDCEKANGPVEIIHIMDMTKEFSDDVENLQTELAEVLEYIDTSLSEGSSFALTSFRDKPTGYLGMPDDYCYRLEFSFDDPIETKLEKISTLRAEGGLDWQENQIGAIWETLNDGKLDFRPDTAKLLILTTDSESHEAGVDYPWGFPPFCPTCDTNPCTEQDYPSREDLGKKLKESQVDAVFFVVHQDFDTISHVSVQLFYEQLLEDLEVPGAVIWLWTGRNQWKDVIRWSMEEFEKLCPTDASPTSTESATRTAPQINVTTPPLGGEWRPTPAPKPTPPQINVTTPPLGGEWRPTPAPKPTPPRINVTTPPLGGEWRPTPAPKPTPPQINVTVPPPGGEWRPTPAPKPTLPPIDITSPSTTTTTVTSTTTTTVTSTTTTTVTSTTTTTTVTSTTTTTETFPPHENLPQTPLAVPTTTDCTEITNPKPTMKPEWSTPDPDATNTFVWTHPPELDFLHHYTNQWDLDMWQWWLGTASTRREIGTAFNTYIERWSPVVEA